MKYLKIVLDPVRMKGDPDDKETLTSDLYEKLQAMMESENLKFTIDEDDSDDDEF